MLEFRVEWEMGANGKRVPFWGDGNNLKLDCDHGCTTLCTYLKSPNCTL